jgi:hypothetical protein
MITRRSRPELPGDPPLTRLLHNEGEAQFKGHGAEELNLPSGSVKEP